MKLPTGYCGRCKHRDTCTTLCAVVEADLQKFFSAAKEIPYADLHIAEEYIVDSNIWNTETYYDALDHALKHNVINKKQYRLLWMRLVDGMSQIEIAEQMGVSQSTISRLLGDVMHSITYSRSLKFNL